MSFAAMFSLVPCPAVLAVELVPESAPSALSLPLESAPLLGQCIADDLARLLPEVDRLGLSVSAALYDAAQVLRPGWPLHAELARQYRQAQRGGWTPAIASFGTSAGRMVAPVLDPDPRLIGSPLLLVPFVLLGPAAAADRIASVMERDFVERGLADAATSLFLNEAFSIRTEHARYLTQLDLCALMAMQYEHVGFAALWSIIECAILSPNRDETADLGDQIIVEYRGGRLTLRGDPAAVGYRRAEAILAAHGLIGAAAASIV